MKNNCPNIICINIVYFCDIIINLKEKESISNQYSVSTDIHCPILGIMSGEMVSTQPFQIPKQCLLGTKTKISKELVLLL